MPVNQHTRDKDHLFYPINNLKAEQNWGEKK